MARPKNFDPEKALAAAMDQFRRNGFDATSLSDITARTGVRKASLYATYGNKRKLFLSTLGCYSEQSQTELNGALNSTKNVKATLRALVMSFVPTGEGKIAERDCLCVNTAIELGVRDAEIAKMLSTHAHRIEGQLAAAIVAGQKRGELNRNIDAKLAARVVQIALYGCIVAGKGCYSRRELSDVVDASLSILDVPRERNAIAPRERTAAMPRERAATTRERTSSAPSRRKATSAAGKRKVRAS